MNDGRRPACRRDGFWHGTGGMAPRAAGEHDGERLPRQKPAERTPAVPGLDDIKKFADDHDEQVDQVLEKVGDAAAAKFGHEDQIDKGIDWAQQRAGGGDTHPL